MGGGRDKNMKLGVNSTGLRFKIGRILSYQLEKRQVN